MQFFAAAVLGRSPTAWGGAPCCSPPWMLTRAAISLRVPGSYGALSPPRDRRVRGETPRRRPTSPTPPPRRIGRGMGLLGAASAWVRGSVPPSAAAQGKYLAPPPRPRGGRAVPPQFVSAWAILPESLTRTTAPSAAASVRGDRAGARRPPAAAADARVGNLPVRLRGYTAALPPRGGRRSAGSRRLALSSSCFGSPAP